VRAAPGDAGPLYVALGDSISIDLYAGGEGRGGASLLARNRDGDFPRWQGRDLASRLPGLRHAVLAEDGGTTRGLVERQLPRVAPLGRPRVVTITVGGNDLLGAYGDTAGAREVVRVVREGVARAVDAVREGCEPGAAIVVGTVYDPSDGTGDAQALGLPPWPDAVAMIGELNAALAAVADGHGALLADVHGAFLGHGLRAGDPRRPDPRPADRDLWFCSLIEPNAWGADGVRRAFWSALEPWLDAGPDG
jgi:lysophospholipase L1-like esterase